MGKKRNRTRGSRPTKTLRPDWFLDSPRPITRPLVHQHNSLIHGESTRPNLPLSDPRWRPLAPLRGAPMAARPTPRNPDRFAGLRNVARAQAVRIQEDLRLSVCRSRAVRRQVLHALKVAGKSGGQKKPRWTENSRVSCKKR